MSSCECRGWATKIQGVYEVKGFGIDGGAMFDKPTHLLLASATGGLWRTAGLILRAENGAWVLTVTLHSKINPLPHSGQMVPKPTTHRALAGTFFRSELWETYLQISLVSGLECI